MSLRTAETSAQSWFFIGSLHMSANLAQSWPYLKVPSAGCSVLTCRTLSSDEKPIEMMIYKTIKQRSVFRKQMSFSYKPSRWGNGFIICASHSDLSCAEALRKSGFKSDIIVCERDGGLPLQRPPLSKTYLDADVTNCDDNFVLRRLDWFTQFDIKFLE